MPALQETRSRDPVIVVVQLTGGNDYLNTVIPYNNPLYRDNRPAVGIPENNIIHLDQTYGIPDYMAPMKKFWDDGKLAILHGVGWKESPRSHFRAMDIWHTCEPIKVGTEGWLGRVAREFDPHRENVVQVVSMGPSLPRALVCPGVPVTCVAGPLERYGFLPQVQGSQRMDVLDRFAKMYNPAIGSGPVMDYLGETAIDALKGEDIIKVAPQKYSSNVEYPNTSIAQKLKRIAQVHLADLGSRIFYCDHGWFGTYADQNRLHPGLWIAVSQGLDAFMADLREHHHADEVVVLMFSEFGRRVRDNGSGTDNGAGGVALVLGEKVKGGHYGEMPSMEPSKLAHGDLDPNMDFRSVYSTILDKWLGLNPPPIVNGTFEKPAFLNGAGPTRSLDPQWSMERGRSPASPPPPPPAASPPPPPPGGTSASVEAHVHIEIEDLENERNLDLHEGLFSDHDYRLTVDLNASEDPKKIAGKGTIEKQEGTSVELQVAIIKRAGEILHFHQPIATLHWYADGTTERATFGFRTISNTGDATFDVLIHRDCYLLFAGTVTVEVRTPGKGWSTSRPVRWQDSSGDPLDCRSRAFRRFARIQEKTNETRDVCIAVQRGDTPDQYLLTALSRNAEYPVRASFSREQLSAHWQRLRAVLNRVRREPLILDGGYNKAGEYVGKYGDDETVWRRMSDEPTGLPLRLIPKANLATWTREYLRELALFGVAMRSDLFRDEAHTIIYDSILKWARTNGVIQIWLDQDALDFVFPWNWIYDGPLDPQYRDNEPQPTNFWGYRYVIEQIAECTDPAKPYSSSAVIDAAGGLRLRVGTWPFAETSFHYSALVNMLGSGAVRLDAEEWPRDKDWEKFLPSCDAHLIYFFSHGHTALPATAGLAEFKQLFFECLEVKLGLEKSEPITDFNAQEETDASRNAVKRLRSFLENPEHDGMWYVDYIELGQGYLKIEDLRRLSIKSPPRPLVFLNMCESAQVYPSLTDGLTHVFLRRGALGVVGTEIPMPPQFGDLFGRRCVKGLAEGRSIGHVLLDLRREFMDARNLLGFAYSYYGDAYARIEPPPGATL